MDSPEEPDWVPVLPPSSTTPRYLAIVASLENDILSGKIRSTTRLLPQRDMAKCLGLSVGTVAKAYAEAERRGLISGKVGRGTFLQGKALERPQAYRPPERSIDLSLNVPPETGESEVIAEALNAISLNKSFSNFLGYLPHQGLLSHREAIATWMEQQGGSADVDRIFITNGAQHALSIALNVLPNRDEPILVEELTYSGMLALSSYARRQLQGVEMDEEGVTPRALDEKIMSTGAKIVYLMPSLQTPTGRTMSEGRRGEIANVIAQRNCFLVEDDTYGFLFQAPPRPISTRIPDRSFYMMSFAKSLAPGLRIGTLTVPNAFRDRTLNALRSTSWMASPIMSEVVARLITNGGLQKQVALKRQEAAARYAKAASILGSCIGPCKTPGFHVWLTLPQGRTVDAFLTQAARAGIVLAHPFSVQPPSTAMNVGVRLCLGAIREMDDLEWALSSVKGILESVGMMSIV